MAFRWRLLVLLLMAFGPLSVLLAASARPSAAQDDTIAAPGERVTVVMTELEPFVADNGGRPVGFYAEIWDLVAAELGVDYEVVWVDRFAELLPALEAGRADVAVAPLAPTASREARFDFTSAVIASGPQLGYHQRLVEQQSLISSLLSPAVRQVLFTAVAGLVILAHLIWLVERNRTDEEGSDFRSEYLPGVWDGFWWATVTVTTVGYGDKAPRSFGGRAVALLAMFLSLFLVGAFVSQVTTVLSSERNATPIALLEDARDHRVGVVEGSTFATYLSGQGVEVVGYDSQTDVFQAVTDGEIDVMVANPFTISVLGPDHGVEPAGDVLYEEFETFGLIQGSPWREPINQALADVQASGEVEAVINRWLD